MNFTAIDFETANNKRTSACSLGLVKVVNGIIEKKINYLFKPIPNYFTNSHIHGIFEKDVINKPHFIEYWDEISSIIGNDVVIAHYAAFDLSVLRYILEFEQIEFPYLKYVCTWRLSESIFDLVNYKLPTISNYLNINLNHHEALSDAEACAKIALNLMSIKKCDSIEELSMDFQMGEIYPPFKYRPFSNSYRKINRNERASIIIKDSIQNPFDQSLEQKSKKNIDRTTILNGESFVISGIFKKHSRDELKSLIDQNGGKNTSSISKKTSYLIAGENMGPSKREKAEMLGIHIISEDEFLSLLQ